MISYILLVGVSAVGVAGLVVSILAARTALRVHLAQRQRARARAELVASAVRQRTERRSAEIARPTPPPPIDGLTNVIEKLEESVRFARVPAGPAVPRPARTATGTHAPPLPPQCYPAIPAPRVARSSPPPIPRARKP